MTFSLFGNWRYCTEDNAAYARPGFDDSKWKTMHIPGNWFLGGLDHHGVVWFRHEFKFKTNGEYGTLHFDGVDYFADVYLNGQPLGRHTGYFEPFAFDVTGVLHSGKNLLAVRVDSPYELPGLDGWHIRKRLVKGILNHHDCRPGGGWDPEGQSYNTGGIWNRVYLEEHGPTTIDQVLLRADLDGRKPVLHIQLTAQNRIRKQDAVLEVRCAPENFKGEVQTAKFKIELPHGESLHTMKMPVTEARLWQPWDRGFPHLYKITTILAAGRDSATASSIFGFRTVKVEQGFHWLVNGAPYFIRGSNYIGSQWLSETLFPEIARSKKHPFGGGPGGDFYTRDVGLAKQANLNLLRVHAHVVPEQFHEACDRAGMLVWQDFPLIWGYSDEPDFQAEAECQMRAMVTMLYNHPSILAWCCHNETPWDSPWMAAAEGGIYDPSHNRDLDSRLETLARELDPTRYVHRASGSGDKHTYPGWYEGHWRSYQNLSGSPFITEYGAQALPVRESLQRMLPQFGPEAGYSELLKLKTWLKSTKKISPATRFMMKTGYALYQFMEKRPALKKVNAAFMIWVMKKGQTAERSIYQTLPPEEATPEELKQARAVWQAWRFHDTQFMEAFENGVEIGSSLEDFIASSQAYQSFIIQYGTETFRRAKYTKVTGIVQFDFTDPWPAVTWSVLDYWRLPKPGYEALRRSMQPVLPSFHLPEKIEAGKAALTSFRAVNDLPEDFPDTVCEWRLANENGDLASATFPVDIPADGVSEEVKLTLPSLSAGKYILSVSLTSGDKTLGDNQYEIKIEDPEI